MFLRWCVFVVMAFTSSFLWALGQVPGNLEGAVNENSSAAMFQKALRLDLEADPSASAETERLHTQAQGYRFQASTIALRNRAMQSKDYKQAATHARLLRDMRYPDHLNEQFLSIFDKPDRQAELAGVLNPAAAYQLANQRLNSFQRTASNDDKAVAMAYLTYAATAGHLMSQSILAGIYATGQENAFPWRDVELAKYWYEKVSAVSSSPGTPGGNAVAEAQDWLKKQGSSGTAAPGVNQTVQWGGASKAGETPEQRSERLEKSRELERLASFVGMINDMQGISACRLSRSGFRYDSSSRNIQCDNCGFCLLPTDRAQAEAHTASCKPAGAAAAAAAPLVSFVNAAPLCGEPVASSAASNAASQRVAPRAAAQQGQIQCTSVHPDKESLAARLATFQGQEGNFKEAGITVAALAENGFFFFPHGTHKDCVKCWVCGGGVVSWKKGDTPAGEHARLYSTCSMYGAGTSTSTASAPEPPPIVLAAADMPAACLAGPIAGADASEEEQALLEENRRLEGMRTCKVCMDKDADTVFLPCGHLVCCTTCSLELKNCAICRVFIRGTVKAFLS